MRTCRGLQHRPRGHDADGLLHLRGDQLVHRQPVARRPGGGPRGGRVLADPGRGSGHPARGRGGPRHRHEPPGRRSDQLPAADGLRRPGHLRRSVARRAAADRRLHRARVPLVGGGRGRRPAAVAARVGAQAARGRRGIRRGGHPRREPGEVPVRRDPAVRGAVRARGSPTRSGQRHVVHGEHDGGPWLDRRGGRHAGPRRALGVLLAALLFGLAEAAGFRLQGLGLPQQATDAAPYVVTLGALFLTTARRRRRPRPSGAVR